MNTPTPRTDKKKFISRGTALYATIPKEVVLASVSETLERELTTMTEQRDGIEAKLRIELRGHPDSELWGEAGLIAATMRCVDAHEEATEQRDRLAEALRKAISWADSASHHILDRQNINWTYLNEAKEAIQSLTPNVKP